MAVINPRAIPTPQNTVTPTPQGLLDVAALMTSPIPVAGDVIGLLSDVNAIRNDPSAANVGMAMAGLLPFVPGGSVRAFRRGRRLTKQEMLDRGADGFLDSAYEAEVPLSKLDGLEPVPAADTPTGQYIPGRQIEQPIEVAYDAATDKYIVYGGNHRIAQARANGQDTVPAFVQPDRGKIGFGNLRNRQK